MNQLKMDMQQAISALSSGGWSERRIARQLGIDRETVGRYRQLAHQNQASNAAVPPAGSRVGRVSHCEPFMVIIQAGLGRGLTAQRIYQDLVGEQKFEGSDDSVKRFVRQLEQSRALPFRRLGTEPGQESQIDFGGAGGRRPGRPQMGPRRTT